MNAWNPLVPLPQAARYALDPQEHVARTQNFETGPGNARQRYSVANDQIDVAIKMSGKQFCIFRTWYRHDTGARYGHAWFSVTLEVDGSGLIPVEARFAGAWKAEMTNFNRWIVAAKLELRY